MPSIRGDRETGGAMKAVSEWFKNKENRWGICGVFAVYLVLGFVIGAFASLSERDNITGKTNPPTGCVYHSYASFINPGYIAGCEFLRKRFDYQNIREVVSAPKR